MKQGWQTRSLGDIAEVGAGNSAPQAEELFAGGTHPFFRTSDAGRIGFGDIHEAVDYLNDEGIKGLRRFPKGTILFPKSGASTFLNHRVMLGVEGFVSNHLATIVANATQVDPRFLLYFLTTVSAQDMIQDHAYPSLNLPTISGIPVLVPPLREQQRIVGVLDDAVEGITTAKAHAEKNLQNARAIFESDLESIFAQGGEGWVKKTVSEVVAAGVLLKPFDGNHGEIHPRKADYTKAGVPFIMASDLQNGSVDTEHCKFISRRLADSLRVGFAKDGDVLISHKGTIGRSAIVSTQDDYIMLTPQVTSYRVKDASKLSNRFLRYYFMSPGFQQEMIAAAEGGATRAYIGITRQLTLRLRFPSLHDQCQIAAKLDALDPETQRLQSIYRQKVDALGALQKSLLHQAFTGNL
jgi:type I restriction enzyme S subunit